MIEFVTLFLALTLGEKPVELVAGDRVAAIELRLDGEVIARKEAPPWRLTLDFGEALLPHELTAVGFDASGRPIAEVRQWLNFSRGQAEARWALDLSQGWPPKKARLVWQSFNGKPPVTVRALFDGEPVELDPEMTVELGDFDASVFHSLEAELSFDQGLAARADRSFGGVYGEEVSTALTALPLRLPEGVEPPTAEEVAGWLRHRSSEPLRIHSLSTDRLVVLIVRDRSLQWPLPVRAADQPRSVREGWRPLRRVTDLYLFDTIPQRVSINGIATSLFKPYEVGNPVRRRGIFFAARRLVPTSPRGVKRPECCQMISDAVAVAGKLAGQSGRRRAVLLLRNPGEKDRSRLQPQQAEGFLRAIRVPFFQWQQGSETALGEVVVQLEQALERQVLVWLNGRFLPQDIELTASAPEGTIFAGTGGDEP